MNRAVFYYFSTEGASVGVGGVFPQVTIDATKEQKEKSKSKSNLLLLRPSTVGANFEALKKLGSEEQQR